MAIRRSPKFRFDYLLRSLPVDLIAKRCEYLMRSALKEVEHLERKERESQGLPVEAEDGAELPPVTLKPFRILQQERQQERIQRRQTEKKALEEKVDDLERHMKEIQNRLKQLNKGSIEGLQATMASKSTSNGMGTKSPSAGAAATATSANNKHDGVKTKASANGNGKQEQTPAFDTMKGDIGPEDKFLEFPEYDGSTEPKDYKKAFAHYCHRNRKSIKESLPAEDRKNKEKINGALKEGWIQLTEDDKMTFRKWAAWDKKRHTRDCIIREAFMKNGSGNADGADGQASVDGSKPAQKRRSSTESWVSSPTSVPKKKKRVQNI
eukprot:CAMPEP_0198123662 /NCGR_PEP_ID=MMETSP1442-20131203/38060_1 /TAXON_ID= /ORGANISM="Craspedostauros australis, Strain CCMP3328" /LENGTH=322 /DNA_ID=CAMNT_0043782897 /DNA_START=33 /DNA_END=1001 /DNA_ORIENTATION=+